MKLKPATEEHVIKHAHLFCGIGVGAKGFNLARPRVANIAGRFECIGETFTLSSNEIWVKPGALALAVDNQQYAFQLDSQ